MDTKNKDELDAAVKRLQAEFAGAERDLQMAKTELEQVQKKIDEKNRIDSELEKSITEQERIRMSYDQELATRKKELERELENFKREQSILSQRTIRHIDELKSQKRTNMSGAGVIEGEKRRAGEKIKEIERNKNKKQEELRVAEVALRRAS